MGLVGIAARVVAGLILVLVGLGAYLYFTDYEAKATVTETGKDSQGHYAVITPRIAPFYDYRAELDSQTAQFVCKDYRVSFRLQSQSFQVFDASGKTLIYDSQRGLVNQGEALRCAALGGNGVLGSGVSFKA